jgi:hypothetical protein
VLCGQFGMPNIQYLVLMVLVKGMRKNTETNHDFFSCYRQYLSKEMAPKNVNTIEMMLHLWFKKKLIKNQK